MGDAAKLGIPGELLEHKQDKKNLRNEAKYFWDNKLLEDKEQMWEYSNPFNPNINEKVLINHLFELMVKSQAMLC